MRWKRCATVAAFAVMMFVGGVATSAENLGYGYYSAAYELYNRAKTATNLKESSDAYADAISYVSRAVAENPDNFNYLTLASLIYRGKGGASYAQNYFLRAEKIILARIKENPTDVESRVKHAILCYAGDGQFSNKAFKYRKEAQREANIAAALYKKAVKTEIETEDLRKMAAMAYLIKGNKRECKKLLETVATENEKDKFVMDHYEKMVEKNNADKDFLIYVLLNVGR